MPIRPAVVAFVLVSLLGGCLTATSITGPASEPQPLPEKPAPLNAGNVAEFVAASEEAETYNDYLERNPTENRVTCRGSVDSKSERGYLASARCTGGVELADGTHVDVVRRTLYYVSSSTVERVPVTEMTTTNYDGSDDERRVGPGFEVVNFADETKNVSVAVEGNATTPTVSFAYEIRPGRGVVQNDLPGEFDATRRIRADTGNETVSRAFVSPDPRNYFAHPTVVVVLPDGSVSIVTVPSTA